MKERKPLPVVLDFIERMWADLAAHGVNLARPTCLPQLRDHVLKETDDAMLRHPARTARSLRDGSMTASRAGSNSRIGYSRPIPLRHRSSRRRPKR